MGLDYTCYAQTKRPLSPQKIAGASPDWFIEFVDADSGKPLHRSRALPSYCLVWGCPRSARLDLAALVRAGNGDSLYELERRGQLGSCALEIETDFMADPEFLADLPPRHRRVLARAGSRYDTSTSASRGGDLSWPLQAAVCRAVALAVGGLLEEPQMGTFRAVSARG
jgi:hypothetical protein